MCRPWAIPFTGLNFETPEEKLTIESPFANVKEGRKSCFWYFSTQVAMVSIPERNRQILEMRAKGISQLEVARRFGLSPSRIWLIERRERADRSMAERRAKLREEIRAADDVEKMWPVEDLIDAVGLRQARDRIRWRCSPTDTLARKRRSFATAKRSQPPDLFATTLTNRGTERRRGNIP
jgi:transcriptional regulator with XRE-family HTH domain